MGAYSALSAQVTMNYYLPDLNYDKDIPTPKAVIGHQIGEWHLSHDKLYNYLEKLCEASENCLLREYARTHEHRPLVQLVISSKENLKNLDEIKAKRRQLVEGKAAINEAELKDLPIVIYQGYSVHGNESSGANASSLVAYYLLAGESAELDNLLDEAIILLDPCYNPDGLQRFSTWANMHKHQTLVTDPASREFNEVWPGGRTNHYWFDLNRDWLFNIHPSSKGRIESFQEWQPDILTDHHEMGSNSTFFFQPGIPSRTNPNTPQINQDLTEEISHFHAAALDSLGSLYYSKESFDDFYYGKGSTYPDINGSIGILFEQASARGHLRDTDNGLLSFPFTIRNQIATSLSTQRAAINLKEDILAYKANFFRTKENKQGAYVFSAEDRYIADYFIQMLNRHEVKVYEAKEDLKLDQQAFPQAATYIVPKDQRQSMLIKTLFETVHDFRDSLFYDVSTWTLPLALNLPYAESAKSLGLGDQVMQLEEKAAQVLSEDCYALAIDWEAYLAPAMLYQLLADDIKVKVVQDNARVKSTDREIDLKKGTLIIPINNQPIEKSALIDKITQLSDTYQVTSYTINSGRTVTGKSIGSPSQKALSLPKVAMIIGSGVNPYEAGATWYQLDQRYQIPVSMLDKQDLAKRHLNNYDIIIMPDGQYHKEEFPTDNVKKWIESGGCLLAFRKAINFCNNMGWIKVQKKAADQRSKAKVYFENMAQARGAEVIGGAIFNTEIDLAHPLFYGYNTTNLPVFKRGTQFYEPTENRIATPMKYTVDPVMSGYTSKRNAQFASEAAAITCHGLGAGRVIAMVDNPNFRGYWLGGSKLFANALFFNDLIPGAALEK